MSSSSPPSTTTDKDHDTLDAHSDDDHEDKIAIERFYELKDATADTLTYTFFAFEALVTLFLLGLLQGHFYIVHTAKAIVLLSLRFYVFKKIGKHYFFLELCTWVHALILVYIWSSWKPKGLFPVIFLFSNGPLIWAVFTWRNAFVPHSMEKMCTLFMHISPSLVTWSIRWYSTPEQGFELCTNPTEPGVNGCTHVTFIDMFINSTPYYLVWAIYYSLIIFVWRAETIKKEGYLTAYNIMTGEKKRGIIYKINNIAGPKYQRIMYFANTAIGFSIFAVFGYYCYHSLVYNYLYIFAFALLACYNGATFYIRVVGKKYYEKEDKEKKQ